VLSRTGRGEGRWRESGIRIESVSDQSSATGRPSSALS
jgi:hypothetical protein